MQPVEFSLEGYTRVRFLNKEQLPILRAIHILGCTIVQTVDLSEGSSFVLEQILGHWRIGLNQAARFETKAFTSSDPPFNSLAYENREKFGLYLHKKAELCYGIFDTLAKLGDNVTLPYSNFAVLWFNVVEEERRWEIAKGIPSTNEDIARRMEQVKKLKKYDNPYRSNPAEWKHNFNLFEAAIAIAKPRDKGNRDIRIKRKFFHDCYLEPYRIALRDYAKELRRFEFIQVNPEKGYAYINQKRTQGKPAREIIHPKQVSSRRLGGRGLKP